MAGLVEEHIGVTVPLLEWTLMALPFSVVMLVLVHVLLTWSCARLARQNCRRCCQFETGA